MLLFGQFYAVVIRSAFKGKAGWSLRMSSSSICSSGVVGCSGVLGTVSPRGISSISRSPDVESPKDTSTTLGSGCGIKGRVCGLTCSGLIIGKGLGVKTYRCVEHGGGKAPRLSEVHCDRDSVCVKIDTRGSPVGILV